jgi:hypothetical protein
MTVLAVPALCTAVGLYPYYRSDDDPKRDRTAENVRRERAENEDMFQAMQRAQAVINRIAANLKQLGAKLNRDQSIDFGDDLADYVINGVVPKWRDKSRKRLEDYCRTVAEELEGEYGPGVDGKRAITILVEGHSDSTQCKKKPGCNWYVSAERAGAFVTLMKKSSFCPGGADLDLRPVGYADTKPLPGRPPTRRIALRLVPNYERLIKEKRKES